MRCKRAIISFFLLTQFSSPTLISAQIMEEETETGDSAEKAPKASHSSERKAMELLASFQDPRSVIWLTAQGEEFLALYQPALKRKPKGNIVMLHAQGQHSDWPGTLAHLRRRLAERGWNTLSLTLADPSPLKSMATKTMASQPVEVRDETEEIFDPVTDTVSDGSLPAPEKVMTNSPLAAEEKSVERIVAGINHLKKEHPGKIILYGQGLGALRASRFWTETGDSSVSAFIFVDAQNSLKGIDFRLPQVMDNPTMPILDIVHSRSTTMKIDAKRRAEQASMFGLNAFQQHGFAEDNERLGNMIYGFLLRHTP